ncbi:unnamed protein product [Cladocopium goreaui]|uniref:Cilia- and flagella-associated protein 97 n=1 Tax=Cladocopium goreaui TaxID=2562237 RepID=A0A9P1DL51_9DINO|nr:unnamed protein product [Cladocopium goreaui]
MPVQLEAPQVARANERHEWEYGQRQHQAALRNIQNQVGRRTSTTSVQTCTRRFGDSYLRRAQVGRENRKLVEKLESIARGYGAWDPRAPPSKQDYIVTPGPFIVPRGEQGVSLAAPAKRVRSLNEPYRYRMQQVIMQENAQMVNRILSVGPTFNRKVEAQDFSRHRRAAQNLQRFVDRGTLPHKSLPALRVPRPSSTWTSQGLEALLVPGDLCRVGSAPVLSDASHERSWEESAGTNATEGGRSEGAVTASVTDQGSSGAGTNATEGGRSEGAVTASVTDQGSPGARTPEVRSPDRAARGLSLNPQASFSNGMSGGPFDRDHPMERRQWLSSDVGAGGSSVSPASPSGPGDKSEAGYSDNWDEESPKSQPSPGSTRSRRPRNGNL